MMLLNLLQVFCPSQTMLSTAQALQEWDKVLKLLVAIKAADPDQLNNPASLADRMDNSNIALAQGLASPVTTWEQLLQNQVRKHACFALRPRGLTVLARLVLAKRLGVQATQIQCGCKTCHGYLGTVTAWQW